MKDYSIFDDSETLDILEALDDILDIVDNFGKENQGDETIERRRRWRRRREIGWMQQKLIPCKIKNSDKYDQWVENHTHLYLDNLEKLENGSPELKREVCHRLGHLESEVPYLVFTKWNMTMSMMGLKNWKGDRKRSPKISQNWLPRR